MGPGSRVHRDSGSVAHSHLLENFVMVLPLHHRHQRAIAVARPGFRQGAFVLLASVPGEVTLLDGALTGGPGGGIRGESEGGCGCECDHEAISRFFIEVVLH